METEMENSAVQFL